MASKVYVSVRVDFREDGKMLPTRLTWRDGRTYDIDKVFSVRPSFAEKAGGMGDRYVVRILGVEKSLFFEHSADPASPVPGRWFVEAEGRTPPSAKGASFPSSPPIRMKTASRPAIARSPRR